MRTTTFIQQVWTPKEIQQLFEAAKQVPGTIGGQLISELLTKALQFTWEHGGCPHRAQHTTQAGGAV
jgi:hypothetical protein